ncbi:MAG TPA: cytochrome c [Gemmataceae bacterium]|nr:cytochrome c [Gemmataceae bacterium]
MTTTKRPWRRFFAASGFLTLLGAALVLVTVPTQDLGASIFKLLRDRQGCASHGHGSQGHGIGDIELSGEPGGTWHWMRSPDEEKRVIVGLYNRYCIRCHGVDGRGVWDIPDVPDFTNARWQACRSDAQLVRATLEGRGACMPPFRGTITLEEAWGMARYLRTLVPGSEAPRPERMEPPEAVPPPKKGK